MSSNVSKKKRRNIFFRNMAAMLIRGVNSRKGQQWVNWLGIALVPAAVLSGLATYVALTEAPPLGRDPGTVIWLLNIDLILLTLLVILTVQRIVKLWAGRKRGLTGADLHIRLIYTFSFIAAAPVIIMTIFSAFFFHYGVQTWFSTRVETAISKSQAVAEAYLNEHKQVIRADARAMASDLERQAQFYLANEEALEKIIQTQSFFRNFSEVLVFDLSGNIVARSGLTFALEFEEIPQYAIREANNGDVVVMTGGQQADRVRALMKLNSMEDTYLFVGRLVDPEVLSYVADTKQASEDYRNLHEKYSDLQIIATLIFVFIGILLILCGIWLGLILARQLVKPITLLIRTADRVRGGDYSARVPETGALKEFSYLAQSFNRMTHQIEEQKNDLISANRQLDRRRRFTEKVLEGVSSAVIGVDAKGKINVANTSAYTVIDIDEKKLLGKKINKAIPEFRELLDKAHKNLKDVTREEIVFEKKNGEKRIFLVRIAIELVGDQDVGAIITFDDITELQTAQRNAAWSDIARRIAHEIKNPLTPIQLSAERLRRKYLTEIKTDPETFSICTDTIIKHVSDIGRMVDEFSSFARMPQAILKEGQVGACIKDVLTLQKQAFRHISFKYTDETNGKAFALFDHRQLRQALNNILQNAVDSIDNEKQKKSIKQAPVIRVVLTEHEEKICVIIQDNGPGFPDNVDKKDLTEPYITHKPKGTGLGLAIVKKIMEDHNGALILGAPKWAKDYIDPKLKGAVAILEIPTQTLQKNKEKGE